MLGGKVRSQTRMRRERLDDFGFPNFSSIHLAAFLDHVASREAMKNRLAYLDTAVAARADMFDTVNI